MRREKSSGPPGEPPVARELHELVQRVKQGDAQALPLLRNLLDEHDEIWRTTGDLARVVRAAWLDLVSDGDVLARESIRRFAEALRGELAGDRPTRAELLLVDHVVNAWLATQQAEYALATRAGGSPQQAAQRCRMGESAQRRFLAAYRVLVTLRAVAPGGFVPLHCLRVAGGRKRA
jgi:hypothetical protein